jgi:LmbE family N-acetylglucosaminyl deacetylase
MSCVEGGERRTGDRRASRCRWRDRGSAHIVRRRHGIASVLRAGVVAIGMALAGGTAPIAAQELAPPTTGGLVALARVRAQLDQHRRVLVIGAHPDDEDTELLAWLARGLGAQAAYLSLNRGEGGQNSIGPELGEALGILRTEELLAAREVDGARQFFTRAYDFGFSKSLDDTWAQWPRDSILKDAVRIIRRFRPQVVVSVFSGTPRDGHGQHQAAGWVAREAFRLAGDASAFPELAREEAVAAWAPSKLYRSTRFDSAATTLVIDGGVLEPITGRTYHQLAMESRSRHRSQDMGQLQTIGRSEIRLALVEDRTGQGAASLFAGIDTTLTAAGTDALVRAEQQALRDRAAAIEAGLLLDAVADRADLAEGDSLIVTVSLAAPVDAAPAVGLRVRTGLRADALGEVVLGGGLWTRRFVVRLEDARAGQPYFLRRERVGAVYAWPTAQEAPLGEPFDAAPIVAVVSVPRADGRAIPLERVVTARRNERAGGGEQRAPVQIVPPVVLDAGLDALVWPADGAARALDVQVRNLGRTVWRGRVRAVRADGSAGAGTSVEVAPGAVAAARVPVTLPRGVMVERIRLEAIGADGVSHDRTLRDVTQGHVRPRRWLAPAAVTVRRAVLVLPTGTVGYVRGPSDAVPEALRAAGVTVRELSADDVSRGAFDGLAAIVVGPRAYETRPELRGAGAALRRFAERGGRVVVQYQQSPFTASGTPVAPLEIQRDRVTEENAAVAVLDSTHAVLRRPHRIEAADWDGWVQERGLQFARKWDAAWQAPIAMHDAGDEPRAGGLLVARVGRGRMVYTGLAFFRQLPAGVPGALRLFLNLLAPDA